VVHWIFETYTKEQKGLLSVAHRLHTGGVRLFGPVGAKYKWSSVGIRAILSNPAYIGNLVWNRRNAARKSRVRNPEDWIVVEGAHPPILWKETFELAGQILKGRRGVRNSVEDYMLRGMAKCADCCGSICCYRQQWRAKNGVRRHQPQLSCSEYHHSRRCYFKHAPIEEVEAALFDYLTLVVEGKVGAEELDVTFPHIDAVRSEAEV